MDRKLTDFAALSFDCYGTLIDWETGIWDASQPLLMANDRDDIRRLDMLAAFGEQEAQNQAAAPGLRYDAILKRVHQDIATHFNLETNDDLDRAFADSVRAWPAFPDTAEALRVLKKHFKLIILSNVHHDGFAVSNQKLGVEFDALYLAEDIGSYKPDPANFEYLVEHIDADFGLRPDDILHTAQSLRHDHRQANEFELANCWIDRGRFSETGDWGATKALDELPEIDFQFFTLAEFADAVVEEGLL